MGAPHPPPRHRRDRTARFLETPRIRVSCGPGAAPDRGLVRTSGRRFRPPCPQAGTTSPFLGVARLCSHCAPAVGDAIRLHPASASSPCLYFRSAICSLLPQPCSRHVFESGSGHVARVGLVLAVILPYPFECWDYPCAITF